jgi:mono/diheme cytochrome c family protein
MLMFRWFRSRISRPPGGNAALCVVSLFFLLALAPPLPAQEPPAEPQAAPPAVETPEPAAAEPAGEPAAEVPEAGAQPAVDPFAIDYLRLCAGCHTIGGGALSGPDLLPSTRWQRASLRDAVERMEKNVGPMTEEQVDGLTDLLQKPDVQARLDTAREARIEEMAATLEPGQPRIGHQLFFGERRFANGGVGCFGCHAAAGRGGNMARDLTDAHRRLGPQSLMSATEKPAFPMMVAAYGARPVTPQESAHLAAFFEQTAAAMPAEPGAQPETEALGIAHAGAGLLFLVVFGSVAVLARRRRAGVRARMVRDSFRR